MNGLNNWGWVMNTLDRLEAILIETYDDGTLHYTRDPKDTTYVFEHTLKGSTREELRSILKDFAQRWYNAGFEDGDKYPYQTNFDLVYEEEMNQ